MELKRVEKVGLPRHRQQTVCYSYPFRHGVDALYDTGLSGPAVTAGPYVASYKDPLGPYFATFLQPESTCRRHQ
jgi:hypothetical protein